MKRAIFFALTFLSAAYVLGAEWEEKNKYHYLPGGKKGAAPVKSSRASRLKKSISPALSVFELEPAQRHEVTAERGTRIVLPENAFTDSKGRPFGGKVTLRVTEVIDPIDFVGAGVDLTYFNEKGQREFFQSAGMFRVDAADEKDQPLLLAAGKKISIEFPAVVRGNDFWVYRHDANMQWKLHGHNQLGEGNYMRVGTRRYQIDALNTWWNFDKPLPEIACGEGRLKWANAKDATTFTVYSIGINYRGSFARRSEAGSGFRVNVHKGALARFLAIDSAGRVGITPPVSIWNKTGFDQAEDTKANPCQDVGVIEVAMLDETIVGDKKRLSEFLGLEVREYTVDYASPGKPGP